ADALCQWVAFHLHLLLSPGRPHESTEWRLAERPAQRLEGLARRAQPHLLGLARAGGVRIERRSQTRLRADDKLLAGPQRWKARRGCNDECRDPSVGEVEYQPPIGPGCTCDLRAGDHSE